MVLAGDRASPDLINDGLAVGLGVQVTDPLLRLGAHPGAVSADISGDPLGTLPLPDFGSGDVAKDRLLVAELGRNLNQGFVDQDGNWIEIGRMSLEAEALRL